MFDLEGNINLHGTIPEAICNLSELQILALRRNSFTGEIPTCLGTLKRLTNSRLALNNLTGTIPPELCQLENLRVFTVQSNKLGGELPPCMGDSWTAIFPCLREHSHGLDS